MGSPMKTEGLSQESRDRRFLNQDLESVVFKEGSYVPSLGFRVLGLGFSSFIFLVTCGLHSSSVFVDRFRLKDPNP